MKRTIKALIKKVRSANSAARWEREWHKIVDDYYKTWTPEDDLRMGFYSQFIHSGDLCFDVGSNIGSRTRVFLALGARVVAVEPQPKCVKKLKQHLLPNPNLFLEICALGASEGTSEMLLSRGSVTSSLSPDWVDAVISTNRFEGERWDKKIAVNVKTLDMLIETYGTPSFIKIDVEGFEYEVLMGLSQPVRALSFEFTPEFISAAHKAVDYLLSIGRAEFNVSVKESMKLLYDDWLDADAVHSALRDITASKSFGDVYVRFL